MTSQIQIKKCTTLPDFHRCVEIQKIVWNESDLETEPYTTFVVANQTGGQVLGAFDGPTMVGFTLAIVGLRDKTPYLHSHMTAVLPEYRDRKIGRALKLFQREEALSRDIRLIEWTFDPLETRNAHFNLNRLGAIVRTYIPDFYGVTSSPLHRGLPTDRLLAEWHLDSARVIAAINDLAPEPTAAPATIHIPQVAPASNRQAKSESASSISSSESFTSSASFTSSTSFTPAQQSQIRAEFLRLFAKHYAATSLRFTPTGADYLLQPWSDF
ncbi:MAG TPA: GNAT family N-acetyltransferase [Candidatus Sulfotelmatobacter sp.]|nr:GNAT family N-acetyltransferase [Candidatus Sulfotelmatobacter sp.]